MKQADETPKTGSPVVVFQCGTQQEVNELEYEFTLPVRYEFVNNRTPQSRATAAILSAPP